MPQKICLMLFISLIVLVIGRTIYYKTKGITVMLFAKTHTSDWLLPPCVLFVVYHLFAYTFDWPRIDFPIFVDWKGLAWLGGLSCFIGWLLFVWGIVSFGKSFRVGIDEQSPGELITSGAFSITRNPLYVAFGFELVGFFLNFPNVFFLVVLGLGLFVLHRQVLREEAFLRKCYAKEFESYCSSVPRYLW